jgi:hypothetical protein
LRNDYDSNSAPGIHSPGKKGEIDMQVKTAICAALVAFCAGALAPAMAKESGDQYPNGSENWMAGALPPPGNYFLNYLGYYDGNLRDGNGDKTTFPGTGRNGSARALFDALRVVKMTNYQLLGGNWGMHAIVPIVNQSLDLGMANGGRTVTDIGDIIVSPFILAWHTEEWHWAAALDVYLPTGKYDKNDPRGSIGTNYYSYEPIFAFTYLNKQGWEASAKLMYNIKSKNTDANFLGTNGSYQSGDEFHMDYLVGKHFGPWGIGAAGYYLKQTQDDKFNGAVVPALAGVWASGKRGEVFSIGPSVTYTTAKGMMLSGTWNHETYAENRFKGDKFWFKLVMPF